MVLQLKVLPLSLQLLRQLVAQDVWALTMLPMFSRKEGQAPVREGAVDSRDQGYASP